MMAKRLILLVMLVCAVSLPGLTSGAQGETPVRSFIELPTEDHYWAADAKIQAVLQSQDQSGFSPEKLDSLREVQKLLTEALRQYKFFSTGEEVFLTDDWRSGMNKIYEPGSPDITRSPLSLPAHLFLAWESGQQTAAQIMVQAVGYSEAQVRRHEALDRANKTVRRSLEAAQKAMDRVVYSSGTDRFFLEVPSSYEAQSTNFRMPVNTLTRLPDGTAQRGVVVNILQAEHTIAPKAYAEEREAGLRKKFSGLSDFTLEDARGDGYEVRLLFSYAYTWDGAAVKAVAYNLKFGEKAIEIVCVSLADHFDREEFERIIRSFHKM